MAAMRSLMYARRDPYLTMLWLGMVGSVLVFAFLSLFYVLTKTASPNFDVPPAFWASTPVIVLSSLTLRWCNRAFAREAYDKYRRWLLLTFVLGLVFSALQVLGWYELHAAGVFLQGAPTGALVYIFTGVHLLHLVGGVLVLIFALRDAFRHRRYVEAFVEGLNPAKRARLKLVSIYWHFVDALWLYLFLFLLYHHYT